MNIRIVGQARDDFCPGFAEVGGLENVGLEIVELVRVHGGVGGSRFERGSFEEADHGPLGNFFGRDVGPVFAAIARQLNQAIIRAGPEQAFLLGRFR